MNDDQNQITPTSTQPTPMPESGDVQASSSPLDLGSLFDGAGNITIPNPEVANTPNTIPVSMGTPEPVLEQSPVVQSTTPVVSGGSESVAEVTTSPSLNTPVSLTDSQDFNLDIDLSTLDVEPSSSINPTVSQASVASGSLPEATPSVADMSTNTPVMDVAATQPVSTPDVSSSVQPIVDQSSSPLPVDNATPGSVADLPIINMDQPQTMPTVSEISSAQPVSGIGADILNVGVTAATASIPPVPPLGEPLSSNLDPVITPMSGEQQAPMESPLPATPAVPQVPGGFDIDKMLGGLESHVGEVAPNPLDILAQSPQPPVSTPTPSLNSQSVTSSVSFFSWGGFAASVFLGLLFLGLGAFYLSVKYPVEFSSFLSQFVGTGGGVSQSGSMLTGNVLMSGDQLSGTTSSDETQTVVSGSVEDTVDTGNALLDSGNMSSSGNQVLEGLKDVLTTGQALNDLNDQLTTQQGILSELIKTAKADKDVLMLKKLLPVQKTLTTLQEQVKIGSGSLDDLQNKIDLLQKELGQLVQ